jgi:hypothetical protein
MNTMEIKATKIICKTIGIAGSLLLTLFSGVFALIALSALVMSIIDKCIVSVIGCVACAFVACILWSIRKDTLV